MGVGKSAKALTARNTCKACAYGMGGQLGGMTNELGEFPSVCNKSVQAQSTDIQPGIAHDTFDHSIEELLAPLRPPDGKARPPQHATLQGPRSTRWRPVLRGTGRWTTPPQSSKPLDPARTFFYSSGRSSNEAGFVFQLLARAWGTNNVNNCSYYCHQATSEGLATTIGKGTSTVELNDLTGADLIFVIGANPASNHPRFIHMLKHCRDKGGDVIIINPRAGARPRHPRRAQEPRLDAARRRRDRLRLTAAAHRLRHRAVQGARQGDPRTRAPRTATSSPPTPRPSTRSAPTSTP